MINLRNLLDSGLSMNELEENLKKEINILEFLAIFDTISNKYYAPLPAETSTEVKILIHEMPQKNPTQRPTIFAIANKQCIRDKINKFMAENDCKESVESYFNVYL